MIEFVEAPLIAWALAYLGVGAALSVLLLVRAALRHDGPVERGDLLALVAAAFIFGVLLWPVTLKLLLDPRPY